MARLCIALLVIAAAVLFVDCKSIFECPKNEQWNDCGTACPPTCEKPNPTVCTLQCRIGCECKPGLLRNKSGKCVEKGKCWTN